MYLDNVKVKNPWNFLKEIGPWIAEQKSYKITVVYDRVGGYGLN
jgi:hypothetical protein